MYNYNEIDGYFAWPTSFISESEISVDFIIIITDADEAQALVLSQKYLAMYLKYHKARLTPTTPVTSIAISSVKMSIGRKSLTNLRSEMIFLQGKVAAKRK